jgi:hypothetical protein
MHLPTALDRRLWPSRPPRQLRKGPVRRMHSTMGDDQAERRPAVQTRLPRLSSIKLFPDQGGSGDDGLIGSADSLEGLRSLAKHHVRVGAECRTLQLVRPVRQKASTAFGSRVPSRSSALLTSGCKLSASSGPRTTASASILSALDAVAASLDVSRRPRHLNRRRA